LSGALPVDKPVENPKPVQKVDRFLRAPVQNLDVQKVDTTKATYIQNTIIDESKMTFQERENRRRFLEMKRSLTQKLSMKSL
jgi:hypothetical protein